MTIRLAGVALAAVMACGWASGAEALTLTFHSQSDIYMGQISTDLFYNTVTKQGSIDYLYYSADQNNPVSISQYGDEFTDVEYNRNGDFFNISLTANVKDCLNCGTFTVGASTVLVFSHSGNIINELASNTGEGFGQTGNLTIDLSPVPLPAALPLFSASLLALGGAMYARRRFSSSARITAA